MVQHMQIDKVTDHINKRKIKITWSSQQTQKNIGQNMFCHYKNLNKLGIEGTRAVLCLVAQLCQTLCNHVDLSQLGSSVHPRNSPGKNTGEGCHSLLLEGTCINIIKIYLLYMTKAQLTLCSMKENGKPFVQEQE